MLDWATSTWRNLIGGKHEQERQREQAEAEKITNNVRLLEKLQLDREVQYKFGTFPHSVYRNLWYRKNNYEPLSAVECWWFKPQLGGPAGFVLGAGFGIFFNMYSTAHIPYDPQTETIRFRDQMRLMYYQTRNAALRNGKNFAAFGIVYPIMEYIVERVSTILYLFIFLYIYTFFFNYL